ncbi:MAG TPA: LuxR C-terminal-related transcriptional regulator [Anaerolineales bacterium]
MPASFLATKLIPPPLRHNFISRPRLEMKLAESLTRRLTLVSAPPGFGKTTLVTAWLEGIKAEFDPLSPQPGVGTSEPPIASWLLLDEGDNELVRFFAYLVTALQRFEPALGQGVQAHLEAPQLPPHEALVTILINDMSEIARNVVLVLDDYHQIRSEEVHQTIRYLIEQQPRNLHLILLTREDPPLPLPRLRARDEITEVREQDLRFSNQEAADFLTHTMGLDLSPEAVATLTDRTEGWAAGLQMAGLSLQNRSDADSFIAAFRGDDRYILDYLMEEVVRRQPQEIQDFLLRTSILDRLCAGVCDAVVERSDNALRSMLGSQSILDYLERSNLFIVSLDNKREWYRYHHLFADLLRLHLMRQFPEQIPHLHRRASDWYRHTGDVEEAMKHALAIPDHALAADLAEGYLHQLIRASRIAACLNWIEQLPGEIIRSRAYLCVSCAWVYMLNGDFEAAGQYLEDSEAALELYEPVYNPTEGRWITLEEVRGHLSAIRAYGARWQYNFPQAIAYSQQALQALPTSALEIRCVVALNLGLIYQAIWEPELAWKTQLEAYEMAKGSRGNLYTAVTALCQLAGIAVWRGKLRQAEHLCLQAIQVGTLQAGKPISLPAVTYAHGWLSAVYNQRNEAEQAFHHMQKALEQVELVGPLATLIYARLFQSRLALDAGDFSEAEVLLAWAEEKSRAYPAGGPVRTEWVVNRGRTFLECGDVSAAARWLSSQGVEAGDLPAGPDLEAERSSADNSLRSMRTRLPEYLLLARVLLVQGEQARAEELLDKIISAAEAWQYEESLLEALPLRAVAAARGENRLDGSRGMPHLERALTLAEPEGYVRPFLIAGESMVRLLRQAIAQNIHPAYASKLLAHLFEHLRISTLRKPAPGQGNRIPAAYLVEPLTVRERQILRLLSAGLSSTQIADQLVISTNTARSYIKSIYSKLGAHSRDEAIEKGTQLNQL